MIGQTLGSYRITTEVARGGQATLYKAVHTVLGRETALKVLHPHLITVADFLQKFEAESKILARLKHPNIVTVYDAGVDQGLYWIAMEWLDGQTVDDLIAQQGKLPVDLAVRIADQVAAALKYAHAQGLIHRDIKPANMMLLLDGTVKVLDFGIAAIIAAGQKAVTRIGTVEYMSYEQFNGQADHRSDIYSLGASLYEMLTGQLPPRLALNPPTPPRQLNPAISQGLEQLLYRLLAQRPEGRPQTTSEFLKQLRSEWLSHMPSKEPPRLTCPSCHSPNRLAARFCASCGESLIQPPQVISGRRLVIPGESFLLTREAHFLPSFSWSPDAKTLAYTAKRSGQTTICLFSFRHPETLIHGVDKECEPQWSPDNKRIAFSWLDKQSKIWFVDITSRTFQQVSSGLGMDTAPRWSADARQLAYLRDRRWHVIDLDSGQEGIQRIRGVHAALSPNFAFVGVIDEKTHFMVATLDGQVLFYSKDKLGPSASADIMWSPDGKYVVARPYTLAQGQPAASGIVVNLETKQEIGRITGGRRPQSISWSPKTPMFIYEVEGGLEACVVSYDRIGCLDTYFEKQNDTCFKEKNRAPCKPESWSSDPEFAFIECGAEIYYVVLGGPGPVRMHAFHLLEGKNPRIAPDWRYLAFVRGAAEKGVWELWLLSCRLNRGYWEYRRRLS